jgi:uncharacterized protein
MKSQPSIKLPAPDFAGIIASELEIAHGPAGAVIDLLDEGCTVPFIARYRKEATGGAEDATIAKTMERLEFHRAFHDRKQVVLDSINDQDKLTPELRAAIVATTTRTELEDLYLPYRPKRRTRATMAREKGLEPLADRLWAQDDASGDPLSIAGDFVDPDKGVESGEDALGGARDIVAERITENAEWRAAVRDLTWTKGFMESRAARGKAQEKSKFTDYYDFSEPVSRIPSHRILAILRGEKEGFLTYRIAPDADVARSMLTERVLGRRSSIWADQIREAAADAYDRLLAPQLQTEIRTELKLQADTDAIDVFASNLRDLLMAAPFGAKSVVAIDPGYRTGCKVVVLGPTGQLLDHGVVYPTVPREDVAGTEKALDAWFENFPDIEGVPIGNGTGGRETLAIVSRYLKASRPGVNAFTVNESGASVYSASEIAREEFPDHDVTVRGAVSIGRRLQDPLSELVKIDPKSIGVGQYQHDVDQKLLKQKLDTVVRSCVNNVGVDVNTASPALLSYVSGISSKIAKNIVAYRDASGRFHDRKGFKKVAGLGEKTFEQAAGFLRVKGDNPLDDSAVHPERYALVKRIASDLGRKVDQLIGDSESVRAIDIKAYVDDTVGLYTLEDIVQELEKPGRDPRDDFEAVEFLEGVQNINDLQKDMVMNGVVTNVTNFGAFVDIGVHQDGLVHVSKIADRFVKDPAEVLHVGQNVRVRVMDIDLERKRISLSIRDAS